MADAASPSLRASRKVRASGFALANPDMCKTRERSGVAAKPPLSPSPASSSGEELLLHPSVISRTVLPPHRCPSLSDRTVADSPAAGDTQACLTAPPDGVDSAA